MALGACPAQALTQAAQDGSGNLMDLSIKAVRLRATVGEISDALEKVFGRHRADTQKISGVYAAAYDAGEHEGDTMEYCCLLYTSPSPRDRQKSRMPSSA